MVVVAVPSKAFREISKSLANFSGTIVSVTKGIEHETGLTMCGVLSQIAPLAKLAAIVRADARARSRARNSDGHCCCE